MTEARKAAQGVLKHVPVGDIVPDPTNRRDVSPKNTALQELAASIKAQGIVQNLIARPHPKQPGKYDLRAGHRRLAAAKIAGLEVVPVMVRDMTDKEAHEVTVIENLHREDLSPLQQAADIRRLLDGEWGAKEIAAELGKSPRWVLRRAQLTKLAPSIVKRIESGRSGMSGWSAGSLELLATLAHGAQEQLLKDVSWLVTHGDADDISKHVASRTRNLRGAPWKLDDAALDPKAGACLECPKRSSRTPGLFDDIDAGPEKLAKADRCLDGRCWLGKIASNVSRRRAEAQKKHGADLVQVYVQYYGYGDKAPKDAVDGRNFEKAKKGSKGAKPCLIVDGEEAGKVFWGRPYGTTSRKSGGGKGTPGKGTPGKPTPLSARRAALNLRREAMVNKELRAAVEQIEYPEHPLSRHQIVMLAACFGTETRNSCAQDSHWKLYHAITEDNAFLGLWKAVRAVLLARLSFRPPLSNVPLFEHEQVAALLELDLKPWRDLAAIEIPEPKGWARLKADGSPKGDKPQKLPKPKGEK